VKRNRPSFLDRAHVQGSEREFRCRVEKKQKPEVLRTRKASGPSRTDRRHPTRRGTHRFQVGKSKGGQLNREWNGKEGGVSPSIMSLRPIIN